MEKLEEDYLELQDQLTEKFRFHYNQQTAAQHEKTIGMVLNKEQEA